MPSEKLLKYKSLVDEMFRIRKTLGDLSPEMGAHLDKMDDMWWEMSEEDKENAGWDVGDRLDPDE